MLNLLQQFDDKAAKNSKFVIAQGFRFNNRFATAVAVATALHAER